MTGYDCKYYHNVCKIDKKECHRLYNQKECSCYDNFITDLNMEERIEKKKYFFQSCVGKTIKDYNFERRRGEDCWIELITLVFDDGSSIKFGAGTRFSDCGAINIDYKGVKSLEDKKKEELIKFIKNLKKRCNE